MAYTVFASITGQRGGGGAKRAPPSGCQYISRCHRLDACPILEQVVLQPSATRLSILYAIK